MKKLVDARGEECPKPVMLTKEAFDDENINSLEIKVDNLVAFENVKRFIMKRGGVIDEILKDESEYTIICKKDTDEKSISNIEIVSENKKIAYVISSNEIGKGDSRLGQKLMNAFITSLVDEKYLPKTLFFMNYGVYLCLKDSEVINVLKKLNDAGVEVIVCGTCTDYLQVTENVSVGTLGSMYDLMEIYSSDVKVISL